MVPGLGGQSLSRSDINRSRIRAAQEEPGLVFSPWLNAPPPSASMPALEAGRCARYQGGDAFERFHFALFRAYFDLSRDISSRSVLLSLAKDAGLDLARFASDLEGGRARAELAEQAERVGSDFTGVPTVVFGKGLPLVGAVPIEVYRRALERLST